ncbi:MAG: riboflavin synthase [Gammaproteobacteria bacterium]|jgi:riboflavin synthase
MFTGIIQAVGTVLSLDSMGTEQRLHIGVGTLDQSDLGIGHSIAVSGVCLTVTAITDGSFSADVSTETLSRTILGDLIVGSTVNLEKPLTLATPLGGHLVSGHVDGTGSVVGRREEGQSVRLEIEAPVNLTRYIAEKGSICVDGVSLTINEVLGDTFGVNIVPHTLRATTMGEYGGGRRVNLEVDIIARYLERFLLDQELARP